MAQSVKHPTLDLSTGLVLRSQGHEFKPHIGLCAGHEAYLKKKKKKKKSPSLPSLLRDCEQEGLGSTDCLPSIYGDMGVLCFV